MRAARTPRASAADQTAALEFSVARRRSVDRPGRPIIDRSFQGLPLRLRIRNFCHSLRPGCRESLLPPAAYDASRHTTVRSCTVSTFDTTYNDPSVGGEAVERDA